MENLAGVKECDLFIRQELKIASIRVRRVELTNSEVPFTIVGKLGCWKFERAWSYWIAAAPEGKGIPKAWAERFNVRWFPEVRVLGFAGGASVDRVLSSLGVCTIDVYHIDIQDGLTAFAGLVRELMIRQH